MKIHYYAKESFSPLAIEILTEARKQVFGEDEILLEKVAMPGPGTLVFDTKPCGGIRTLTPRQIPTVPHALTALCDSFRLYRDGVVEPNMTFEVIDNPDWFKQNQPRFDEIIAVDIETTLDHKTIKTIAFCYDEVSYVCTPDADFKTVAEWLAQHYYIVGANFKFDQRVMALLLDVRVPLFFDTFLAHHAQNIGASGWHGLEEQAEMILGAQPWKVNHKTATAEEIYEHVAWDVYWTRRLYDALVERFDENTLRAFEFQMQMSHFFLDIELHGFAVDLSYVEAFDTELELELEELLKGLPVDNPNSWQQWKNWYHSQGKRIPNTNKKTIETLVDDPDVGMVARNHLRYNKLKTGRSNFTQAILKREEGGIVRPEFNIGGTNTGRLSSSNPNIQNQPRDVRYRQVWKAKNDGNVICAIDLDQAEARVMAWAAQDVWLRDKLMAEEDFFTSMLPDMFPDVDFDAIDDAETKEYRTSLKTVIYGLSFGRGDAAIAKALNSTVEYAANIKNTFLGNAYKLNEWREGIKQAAVHEQYRARLINPFGRTYQMEIIHSDNSHSAQRSALSFIPQSSSSDLCIMAAMRVQKALSKYGAHIVATVHDSIIIDCPEEFAVEVSKLTCEILLECGREVFGDFVDFTSEYEIGPKWGLVEQKGRL